MCTGVCVCDNGQSCPVADAFWPFDKQGKCIIKPRDQQIGPDRLKGIYAQAIVNQIFGTMIIRVTKFDRWLIELYNGRLIENFHI